MKKMAVLGSCLSSLVAKNLVSMGYQLVTALHHIRLDAFSAFLNDETALGASPVILRQIFERVARSGEGDEVKKINGRLLNKLNNQKKIS